MKVKALVLVGKKQLEIQEIEISEPKGDEIIVDVAACGVCGTDIGMYNGDKGAFENEYPLVMGHEFSGVVSEIGPDVKNLKIGDKVSIDPNLYCGNCKYCLSGKVHFCENMIGYGTTLYGGFAEKCKVRERAAYKVSDEMPLEHAALVEPLSCSLHGIDRSNILPGNSVAIIGAGSIGQIMIQIAKISGASKIYVIEPVKEKRESALKQGATLTFDPREVDVYNEMEKLGFVDTVIECAGRIDTMEQAVSIVGKAGTVMLFGLSPVGEKMEILPLEEIFQKEITITASFINPLVSQRVIDLIDGNRLNLDKIITDRIPLEDSIEVFSNDSYRERGKILIIP